MPPLRLTLLVTSFCSTDTVTRFDDYTPLSVVYTPLTIDYTPLISVYTPHIDVYLPLSSLTIEWLAPVILSLLCALRESPLRAQEDVALMMAPQRAAWARALTARPSGASVRSVGRPARRPLRTRRSVTFGRAQSDRRKLRRLGAPPSVVGTDGEMVRGTPRRREG